MEGKITSVDEYINKVIKLGDEGSELLNAICAPTLKNSPLVDILEQEANRISVLRIPKNHRIVVHSASGDPKKVNLVAHARSLVCRLVEQAKDIGATPVAFSNVIDSSSGEKDVLEVIAENLVFAANEYKIAIMNGENAILGSRIACKANVSGTMISIIPKDDLIPSTPDTRSGKMVYRCFDPEGKAVFINSDGVGTKTEFYERAKKYKFAVNDFMAMNLDDTIKLGATAKVITGVVETKGRIPFNEIRQYAEQIAENTNLIGIMQHENVGNRLRGYNSSAPAYNISGSVVSVIDEEKLKNPLKPKAGDLVIAIRGKPNPRSNGITDKRKTMIKLFGENWHKTREGKIFLEYLASPSTILYPIFKELIDKHLATSVYHMSGGAYNGKLARPLAKHNLFVKLQDLFPPDWRELALAGASFTSAEAAYSKWPMGNDGFVTVPSISGPVIDKIKKYGLEGRVVGWLRDAVDGRTGVELEGIKASNGNDVYFSGR